MEFQDKTVFSGNKTKNMEITDAIKAKIELLNEKYSATGQDMEHYLEGLIYAKYLNYWDYIQLETLLSLQRPRTDFPDEEIFIMYHQITELYFKLAIHEFDQIGAKEDLTLKFLTDRIKRINNYFEALTHSFEIMINGMEKEQFLKYRMSLLPASGFQSAQYRKIEIASAPMQYLVQEEVREELKDATTDVQFDNIYWKRGATELATGKKTYTLIQFEQRYAEELKAWAAAKENSNIWKCYLKLSAEEQKDAKLLEQMKWLDVNVNINWPLCHYKSAVRYLKLDPVDIAATGGTNWQKYLPPKFQKRIFFPEIWSDQEKEEWGKKWVENALNITL